MNIESKTNKLILEMLRGILFNEKSNKYILVNFSKKTLDVRYLIIFRLRNLKKICAKLIILYLWINHILSILALKTQWKFISNKVID